MKVRSTLFLIYILLSNSEIIPANSFRVYTVGNTSFEHAESPVWDGETGVLYWVDVHKGNLYALDYATREHRVKHIEYGEVNVVTLVRNSHRLLVTVRAEVFLLDWRKPGSSALRLVAALDLGYPDNVINEGKADPQGRFWAGTKGLQNKKGVVVKDKATLYSLEQPYFVPQVKLKPVSISNGLVWGLNGSILYYIDSKTRRIDAFDFNSFKGQISYRRKIIDLLEYGYGNCLPDGMTLDREGHLWVALIYGSSVIRIDPEARRIVERYNLPISLITSVTWAGPGLRDLVVTTSRRHMSRQQLAKEPLAGFVLILRGLGTAGVPNDRVAFEDADKY